MSVQALPATDAVDLRSDTVTLPTDAMYAQMRAAPLGDDGLDGDPTARQLEAHAADLLGKEAGLYTPSATMANLLALLAQSGRLDCIAAGVNSHIYTSEAGASAFTEAFLMQLPDPLGALDLQALADAVSPARGSARPTLLCVETSHNNEGGAVAPLAHMQQVHALAQQRGVKVHLDGARLFNAAAALEVEARSLCAAADTVAVCLSKGLSAPMGAVLLGPEATIRRARVLRKALGGAQRQVGIAAAAGLEALSPAQIGRLAEDHATARRLAQGLAGIDGLAVNAPQTNIVMVDVQATGGTGEAWETRLRERGVQVRAWGPHRLRCVTHRHVDAHQVDRAAAAFRAVADCLAETA